MKLQLLSSMFSALILRVVMGIIFVSHGAARIYYGSVVDFGSFLDGKGFMIGFYLAWLITIGELVFGTLLAAGYKVKYCVIFHAVVILGGMVLIHIPQGWFVVGHGSGGVEYSLLILAVLLFLYSKGKN